MKIAYHGYYGARNSGDDAFAEVAVWGAERFWNCREHLFYAPEMPGIKRDANFLPLHNSYLHFGKAIWELYQSNVFVSAGGSTFHSSPTKTDIRLYAKLKKQMGIKGQLGAIGISLGPYTSKKAEKNTVSYLQQLDFLALRDNYSYQLASSYNLPYQPINAFDLAALLPDVYNELKIKKTSQKKIVGISVCLYESYLGENTYKEENRNKFIYYVLNNLQANSNIKFRFFIFNGHPHTGDRKLTHAFLSNLSENKNFDYQIIPYVGDVKQTFQSIQECDLILSTRLHASIFACFAGVPFMLLEYHRKCQDFLNDIGQHESYRLYDAEKGVAETINQINNILYNNEYIPPKYVQKAKEKSLLNFLNILNN